MTRPDDPDALRVGDREREQAVAVLQDAVGGGYLDLQEFEERSRTVYAAKTRGQLRTAVADLPIAAGLFPPVAAVVPGPSHAGVGAGKLNIDWATVKRKGHWEVPAHLVISGSMGNADLDLREAVIPAAGCVIEVIASWSTVKIRLGDAIVVRTDGFEGGSTTTLKNKAGPPTVPGGPLLDIRGRAGWTTIVLRRS